MSALLVACATMSALAVSGFAVKVCAPRLWTRVSDALCGPVEDQSPSARPLVRPGVPDARYAQVWQHPDAAVDRPKHQLRRDERDLFDELVYVHDFLSPNIQPLTSEEQS